MSLRARERARAERRESLRYSDLVVKPRRPTVARAAALLAVALVVVASLTAAFEGGRRFGAGEWRRGAQHLAELQGEARALLSENDSLRRQVASLRTSRAVADEAHEEVRRMLVELEDEVQRQREELDFYRTIVSPEDGVAGLRIQDFSVIAAEGRLYRMQLVLVQAAKHDKPVSGIVSFALEGANAGRPARFAAAELAPAAHSEAGPLGFSFRYFKDLEQDVLLPEGFVPDRVVVEVSPEGDPERVIRQSFDWAVKS